MFRVCVVLFAVMCAEAKVSVGRAFFCRDPDTGKLHPVNTNWTSTTFCGNYHCRLRKKNLTSYEYPLIRQFNISKVDIHNIMPTVGQLVNREDKKFNLKNDVIDVISNNNLMKHNINNITRDETIFEGTSKVAEDDRYLTEKEIAAISEILHTVKKSDLDAVIEIYNLAQDIYRKVDQNSPENLMHETVNEIRQDIAGAKKSKLLKSAEEDKVSYWYEPIAVGKIRQNNNEKSDMASLHSTLIKVTTPKPGAAVTATTERSTKTVNSYFDRTLTSIDFGKLPYYYPISNFQKIYSYVHKPPEPKKHISPANVPEQASDKAKYTKNIKPSFYLPYPFTFIPRYYNWSYPHNIFYNKNYIEQKETKKDKTKPINNAVLINPDLENYQDLFKAVDIRIGTAKEEKVLRSGKKPNEKFEHDWQTDSISKHILEETRAHIEKPKFIKPFFLRKNVELDRIEQLLKIDDLSKRSKRDSDDLEPELYEVYIERTTHDIEDRLVKLLYANTWRPQRRSSALSKRNPERSCENTSVAVSTATIADADAKQITLFPGSSDTETKVNRTPTAVPREYYN